MKGTAKGTAKNPTAGCAPKCPACGATVTRPRCLFELGGDCPRHQILADFKKDEKRRQLVVLRSNQELQRAATKRAGK